MNFDLLHELISKYDIITIYSHINPDFDALGSSFGMKYLIEENYKNKQVEVIIEKEEGVYPKPPFVDNETISNSLALIMDVSIFDRVSDQRFKLAKCKAKIDHHPDEDEFDYEFASTNYAATCEIVTDFIINNNLNISQKTANALYRGFLTDTLSFKTANTTYKTMERAAFLVKNGVDLRQTNNDAFSVSLDILKFRSAMIANKLEVLSGVGILVITLEDIAKFNISYRQAKEIVGSLSGIRDFDIYAVFCEKEEGLYNGSLRSQYQQVNDIAKNFNGGGHYNAAGVHDLNIDNVNEIIKQLTERNKK